MENSIHNLLILKGPTPRSHQRLNYSVYGSRLNASAVARLCYKWDRAIMLQEILANLDSHSQYPRAEEACERVSLIIVAITRTSVSFPGTTY